MNLNLSLLFLSSMLSGIAVFFVPALDMKRFKVILTFSGAYLFSITVIHILPELFHEAKDFTIIGIYVLAGFFLQMILEYFTSGVEHGHIHLNEGHNALPYSMLISLGLHSFLEGSVLVHPVHGHGDADTLLYGLILHKIPESFALMSVLVYSMGKKYMAIVLLLCFSFASPLGLVLSSTFYNLRVVPENIFVFLFALVAGNFLYISTTIFFETSPNHQFKANKLLVSLMGAAMAIAAEFFINK